MGLGPKPIKFRVFGIRVGGFWGCWGLGFRQLGASRDSSIRSESGVLCALPPLRCGIALAGGMLPSLEIRFLLPISQHL